MIDLATARAGIAKIITDHCPSIAGLYPRALATGVPALPAVVFASLISGEFDTVAGACAGQHFDTIKLPLVVIVGRPGVDEIATQTELEEVWVEVLDALREHLPSLGLGFQCRVRSVEPGSYVIGSAEYPGQILQLEIKG